MDILLFTYILSFLYHCQCFIRTWLYIWVIGRVSYNNQELLPWGPSFSIAAVGSVFLVCCRGVCLFCFPPFFCCTWLCLVTCLSYVVWIVHSVFSNVYFEQCYFTELSINHCHTNPCNNGACQNLGSTYMCVCDHGYYEKKCECK